MLPGNNWAGIQNRRHIEITLAFKELLSANEQINRNVSHYAESLHISPVYLNEVVKNVTGVSVSRYIQNELILHAKRMLVYTSLTVREISIHLGIDDYAYFTRVFTKAVGISPTLYRKNTSNSAILTLHSLFFYLSMHCNFANKKMNRNRFIYFTDLMLLLVFIYHSIRASSCILQDKVSIMRVGISGRYLTRIPVCCL